MLVGGARHQLDLIQAEAARRQVTVHIVIDFMRMIEKHRATAWDLHHPGDPTAEEWVATHAPALPVGVLLDELPHTAGEVDADVVLGQDDRAAQLDPGPDEQAAEALPSEATWSRA